MHCPAPICSDLSYLVFGCNNLYSVTVFPKQGKMEQVTAGCSSKMVVKIVGSYYRYFIAPSGTYFQLQTTGIFELFNDRKGKGGKISIPFLPFL